MGVRNVIHEFIWTALLYSSHKFGQVFLTRTVRMDTRNSRFTCTYIVTLPPSLPATWQHHIPLPLHLHMLFRHWHATLFVQLLYMLVYMYINLSGNQINIGSASSITVNSGTCTYNTQQNKVFTALLQKFVYCRNK